jgi:hypothetical protein
VGRGRRLGWLLAAAGVAVAGLAAVRAVPVVVAAAEAPAVSRAAPSSASASAPSAAPPSPAGPAGAAGAAMPPTVSGADVPTDWASVLEALDAGRRAALGTGSADELARYVDPAGAAWAGDVALLRRLQASGARLEGGVLELGEVRLEQDTDDVVRLSVRDRRLPYDLVEDGRSTHVGERPWRWWSITLAAMPSLDGPSWRVRDVVEAEGPARS